MVRADRPYQACLLSSSKLAAYLRKRLHTGTLKEFLRGIKFTGYMDLQGWWAESIGDEIAASALIVLFS
jgi:hypothetical protein